MENNTLDDNLEIISEDLKMELLICLEELDKIKLKTELVRKEKEIITQHVSDQMIIYINRIRTLTKSLSDTALNDEQVVLIQLINMYANQLRVLIK